MGDTVVEERHLRTEPERRARGGAPEHPGPEDHEAAGRDARHASQEDALAAELVQQQAAADDHGEAAGDLGHAVAHGCVTRVVLDRLDADRGHLARHQGAEVLGTRRGQPPEAENDPVPLEELELVRVRRVDRGHQRAPREHLVAAVRDLRAGRLVVGVRVAGGQARVRLHPHAVALLDQRAHA